MYCTVGNIIHLMCSSFPRSEAWNWIYFLAAKTTCNYAHVVIGTGGEGEQIARHNSAYRENAFPLYRRSFLLCDPPRERSRLVSMLYRLDRKLIRKKGSSDDTYKEVIDFFVRLRCSRNGDDDHDSARPTWCTKNEFFFYRCNLKHLIEFTNIIYYVGCRPRP